MAALPMGLSLKILTQNKNLLDFSKEVTFDDSTRGVSVFLDVQRSFPASLLYRDAALPCHDKLILFSVCFIERRCALIHKMRDYC